MKKFIVMGSGAACAFAISAVLGTGIAAADDYAGKTYADASAAASDAGQSVTIAAKVGDQESEADCLVTRSQLTPFTSANDGSAVDGIQFYLNCNEGVASAVNPGNSAASPVGRETKAAEEKAANAEEQELEQVSTPDQ